MIKQILNNTFGEVNHKTGKCRFWNHDMIYSPRNISSPSNQSIDGKPIMYMYYRDILICKKCGKKEYGDLHFGHTSFGA